MSTITLKSIKRDIFGRKVKQLRKKGLIPANIFGNNIESESISVDSKEFSTVFKKAGETQIIDLNGKPVLVSNIQVHPVDGEYLHIDFRQVDLKQKIEAKVPVEIEGESPAEKQNLGTVVQQLDEIEVEALPADLPEKIIVDISGLVEVDQAIHVKDLKVSKNVVIKTDMESIVVKIEPPIKEEVVEVAPVAVEGEAVSENPDKSEKSEVSENPTA